MCLAYQSGGKTTYKILNTSSAEDVNKIFKDTMGYEPPYKPGTSVTEILRGEILFQNAHGCAHPKRRKLFFILWEDLFHNCADSELNFSSGRNDRITITT